MNRLGVGLALGIIATIAAVGQCSAADGEETAISPGMRVYIDPETGDFGAAPEADREEASPAQRAHSVEDLVEEVNPAGGYSVDLKRRFGGVVRAVAGPTGVEVECESGAPAVEK